MQSGNERMEKAATRRSIFFFGGLTGVLFLALSACGSKPQPPEPTAPAQNTPVAAAANAVAQPEAKPEVNPGATGVAPVYTFTPAGKRDPFKSAYKELKAIKPEGAEPGEILTTFELDQLKLVAVISGIAEPKAMVEDPEGKGHVVKVGTKVGKRGARIVRIRTDEVIVAEDYRDWNQRKVTNYIHLTIVKDKDKGK